MLIAGACAACSSASMHADAAETDVAASEVQTDGAGVCVSGGCACGGFIMPNPTSVGLPHPASYRDNHDTTVTDLVTGFLWDGEASADTMSHDQAVAYCAGRGPEWRLPTRIELVSLVDFTVPAPGPTINTVFANTPGAVFWTSSPNLTNPMSAWGVSFDIGYADYDDVSDAGYARCLSVPDGASRCYPARYMAAGPTEVLDAATQLTWQQPPAPEAHSWADARAYCTGLGGSWRLPSMTELQTLVDDRQKPSTINPQAFPNTPADVFWTSSPVAADIYAWGVDFSSGNTTNPDLSTLNRVRCVH